MTPQEVPDCLVEIASDLLEQNGLWGAWEREQTEEEVRSILAVILPIYDEGMTPEALSKIIRGFGKE